MEFLLLFSDVNECEVDPDICDGHTCINNPGSYWCKCQTGYESSNSDGTTCQGNMNIIIISVEYIPG